MSRFVAVFGLVAVLAVAGCGGDDGDGGSGGGAESGDERAAHDTVRKYVAALVDRDTKAACALQTKAAQEAAADEVPGASSCERAHEIILGVLGTRVSELEEKFEKALTDVEVTGDTAELSSPKEPGKVLKLRRENGQWKIDDKVLSYTPK